MRARAGVALAALLAGTLAPAPGRAAADAALPVPIAASIHPLALLVQEIGGERVRVAALVPPGASPHTFEPRPSDVARLARARAFVRVGAGLDDWALRLLGAAPRDLEVLEAVALAGAQPLAGGPGARPGVDPHLWLDPLRVRDALLPALAGLLSRLDPPGAAHYARRREEFAERLTALDAEVRRELEDAPSRRYVAFHNAWRYFAQRYDLEEVGVVEEFAGEEPTPRELARLVAAARAAGVRAILVEPQISPRVAQVLAAEIGGRTVLVDPQGDPRDPARSHYEGLIRFNARAFREALGGGGA